MLSRLFPNPSFHGWRVLGAAVVFAALSGPGQSYLLSLYIDHLVADLQLSRLDVSAVYGAATIAAALALPWVGARADRMTSAAYARAVLALLALAMVGLSLSRALWAVALSFFALRLLGQGAISLGIVTTVVRWFRRYRGRAFAITSVGYSLGEATLPSAVVAAVAAFGWRGSLWALAAAYLLLFAPLVGAVMRERDPEREPRDGAPDPEASELSRALQAEASWDPRDALRSPVFWTLLACSCVSPFLLTGMLFHLPAILRSVGWEAAAAPRAFAAYALAGMVCTYLAGFWLERVHSKIGLASGLFALGLGAAAVFLPLGPALGPSALGAALGGSAGIANAANGVLWPAYFGVRSLGALRGVVNLARNGCTAAAPPLAAWLAGPEESFGAFAALCVGLAFSFALVALLAPRQAEPRPRPVPAAR